MKIQKKNYDDVVSLCPFCKGWNGESIVIKSLDGKFAVRCKKCGAQALFGRTYRIAVKNWNRRMYSCEQYERGVNYAK